METGEYHTRLFMYLPFMSYLDVIVNVEPARPKSGRPTD
jgi:hypothetical protein